MNLPRPARLAAALAVTLGLAACGGGRQVDSETPTADRPDHYPAAVVSTTSVPTGGATASVTATTLRRGAAPVPVHTTTTAGVGTPPAPRRSAPPGTPLPEPRTQVGAAAWQGQVVVAGGDDHDGDPSARVDLYDPTDGRWRRAPDLPAALHDVALVAAGDVLWAVGGFIVQGDQSVAQANSYYLGPNDSSWGAGPNLHTARGALGLALAGNTLVAFGGVTTDGGVLDSVETLTNGDDAWKAGPSLIHPREYAGATTVDGRAFAIAGRAGGPQTNLTSVESWKPGDDAWRDEPGVDEARSDAGAAGGCVAGGEKPDGSISSVECFAAGHWAKAFNLAEARHGAAVAVLDGYLHVIGGSPSSGVNATNTHEVFALS